MDTVEENDNNKLESDGKDTRNNSESKSRDSEPINQSESNKGRGSKSSAYTTVGTENKRQDSVKKKQWIWEQQEWGLQKQS